MTRWALTAALLLALAAPGPAVGRYAAPPRPKGKARLLALLKDARKAEAVLAGMFPEQRAASEDPCRFKALWTTRRAGKSSTVLRDFTARALKAPGTDYCFIALTRRSAKRIAWKILKDLDQEYDLRIRFQEADLVAVFPNGSEIHLVGADKSETWGRFYGWKLAGVAIDEAAFYARDIEDLIKDYIGPALTDLQGVCYLMSIPGHLPRGLFFWLTIEWQASEIFAGRTPTPRKECPTAGRWSVHTWTYKQNPHICVQVQAELDAELEAYAQSGGDALQDPRIIRNYLKGWVVSSSELVYRYENPRNVYQGDWKKDDGWRFCISLDLGWKDYVALVVMAYRTTGPLILVVDTWRTKETLLGPTPEHPNEPGVAGKLKELMAEYPGADIVCDPAHLYTFEQLRRGYGLPIMEAEKAKKYQSIQLMNSDMIAGHVQVLDPDPHTNPLVEEWTSLTWQTAPDGTKREMRGQRNDMCDAGLTGWRHVHHYVSGEEEPGDTRSRAQREEDEMIAWAESEAQDEGGKWYEL